MVWFIEWIVTAVVIVASSYSGYLFATRSKNNLLSYVLAGVGVCLVSAKSIALWIPFYAYLPRMYGMYMDILQALGAILIGVAWYLMKNISRQRILWAVFTVLFLSYMLFDKTYLFLHGEKIRNLEGKYERGVVRQSTGFTCYPASIATILKHWKIEASEGDVAYLARTTPRGTDPFRILYAVELLGESKNLQAWPDRISINELDEVKDPIVLIVFLGKIPHAIVYFGKEGENYVIGDPVSGKRAISKSYLVGDYLWAGDVLKVYPKEQ